MLWELVLSADYSVNSTSACRELVAVCRSTEKSDEVVESMRERCSRRMLKDGGPITLDAELPALRGVAVMCLGVDGSTGVDSLEAACACRYGMYLVSASTGSG